jgi:hypothetical protein
MNVQPRNWASVNVYNLSAWSSMNLSRIFILYEVVSLIGCFNFALVLFNTCFKTFPFIFYSESPAALNRVVIAETFSTIFAGVEFYSIRKSI